MFDPPLAGRTEDHHSYVARCIMNRNFWWETGAAENGGYGTLVANTGIPRDRVRCIPCTDRGSTDLTVPDVVVRIPPWAFSNCSIAGTVHFHIDGSRGLAQSRGVQQIAEHAFDLTRSGSVLGSVVIPYTLVNNPLEPLFDGLGEYAFRASRFTSFLVGVPEGVRPNTTTAAGFPNFPRDWWMKRLAVQDELRDTCYSTGSSALLINPESEALHNHVKASPECDETLVERFNEPPVRLSRLFSVCKCEEMESGCFYDGRVNPKATLPNATTQHCSRGRAGRVGPVILPYYKQLLPSGATPIRVNVSGSFYNSSEPAACTVTFDVYISADAIRSDCDVCDASQCVPSGLDLVAQGLAFVDEDDTEDGLVDADPFAPEPTQTPEEPLPVAAIVAISIGSAFILTLLGIRLWRRRRHKR